jgi:hypothetical protein
VLETYNLDISDAHLRDDEWLVWWDQPNDCHTWAFIHWCKRNAHKVAVKRADPGPNLHVAIKRPQW